MLLHDTDGDDHDRLQEWKPGAHDDVCSTRLSRFQCVSHRVFIARGLAAFENVRKIRESDLVLPRRYTWRPLVNTSRSEEFEKLVKARDVISGNTGDTESYSWPRW